MQKLHEIKKNTHGKENLVKVKDEILVVLRPKERDFRGVDSHNNKVEIIS